GKTFLLELEMCTLLIFRFYDLKIKLRELIIPAMTVDAVVTLFHPELSGMGKFHIISGMAVGTAETFMIRIVKFIPVNYPFREHHGFNLPSEIFVGVFVSALAVALKTAFIVVEKRRPVSN
ncbi:MAG: hypothetical protein H6Q23_1487, partial [Bacteroidetes bacterium]|nr:hypothetical protein [Bacteroidota bacterium]